LSALGSTGLRASPAEDYVLHCRGCHGTSAQGVPGKIPPLAHSLGLFLRSPAGRNYVLRVPGAANSALSDTQLAGVLNWLLREYNGRETPAGAGDFSVAEVTQWRHQPLNGVLATRQGIIRELSATGPAPVKQY
jgi:hypothetical protein